MMQIAVHCVALLSLIAVGQSSHGEEATGENWAVLVAGSKGWSNYRHQAGVCHAYQVLIEHGIPQDHIVTMMYDDLAYDWSNPDLGKIVNQPGGPNVYEGIQIDYRSREVTPENFFKVLTGDANGLKSVGSSRVVKSGPNDRIFINMVDHGNVGFFSFPYAHMYADDLYEVIQRMYDNNMYKEMVMYMESCESGSMFDEVFPNDISFYSTTSANPTESSYATYYDSRLQTYIGDLYGCCWMENSDTTDLNQITLGEQYEVIKECNHKSHSPWYGQQSMQNELVSAFLGTGGNPKKGVIPKEKSPKLQDAVPSEDVPLMILRKKLESAAEIERSIIHYKIDSMLKKREFMKDTTEKIASLVTGDVHEARDAMQKGGRKITNWPCYKSTVNAFSDTCFNLHENEYALIMTPTMLNLCESGYDAQEIISAMHKICTFGTITGIE